MARIGIRCRDHVVLGTTELHARSQDAQYAPALAFVRHPDAAGVHDTQAAGQDAVVLHVRMTADEHVSVYFSE